MNQKSRMMSDPVKDIIINGIRFFEKEKACVDENINVSES